MTTIPEHCVKLEKEENFLVFEELRLLSIS
jgi:hypothetical protein